MSWTIILTERAGPALVLTLNTPDKLNAFTVVMRDEIIAALDKADADDAVHAVIVTGAGRGFCAGADMSRGASRFDVDARAASLTGICDNGGIAEPLSEAPRSTPEIRAVIAAFSRLPRAGCLYDHAARGHYPRVGWSR